MIREEGLKPLAGAMGALGISTETSVDFGKERRTTTIAPPGEMLMAVANSRESLPPRSQVRIKTGMASCNRAHLRSSFFDKLLGTCLHHPMRDIHTQESTPGAKLRTGVESAWNHSKPPHQQGNYRSNCTIGDFIMTAGQAKKVQRFSLRVPVSAPFPIDSLLHLT
jgi:hypothetical protein